MFNHDEIIKLTDLVDIEFLQEFQDSFVKTMGVSSIFIDIDKPITKPSNFTDFCSIFVRCSESNLKCCDEVHAKWGKIAAEKGETVIYTCPNGLTEFVVPIFVEEIHVGSVIGGQIFLEPPNEEHYREIAGELGVD